MDVAEYEHQISALEEILQGQKQQLEQLQRAPQSPEAGQALPSKETRRQDLFTPPIPLLPPPLYPQTKRPEPGLVLLVTARPGRWCWPPGNHQPIPSLLVLATTLNLESLVRCQATTLNPEGLVWCLRAWFVCSAGHAAVVAGDHGDPAGTTRSFQARINILESMNKQLEDALDKVSGAYSYLATLL